MADRIALFRTTPRIVMGTGAVASIGQEVRAVGGSHVLVVTDAGILGSELMKPVEESLDEAGLTYNIFSEVSPDPPYEIVNACLTHLGQEKPDCVIGMGGGSPIDIAKCVAVMLTNPGTIHDYLGVDLVQKPGVPTIMIPTTAGTGSETTPIAILSDEGEKLKKGVVSPYLFPRTALLDPELTLGLPPRITAATGMDALIHAIEAYTSRNATSLTDLLARQAIQLIAKNLRTAYANGLDIEARSKMMEASLLAGIAFANAGVTAVHAFAYPIGAEFHIPHGIANTIMLAPVMEFNMMGNLTKFAEMAELLGENVFGLSERHGAQAAVESIRVLAEDLRVPRRLSEYGVQDHHITGLAEGVMKVTRLLANNPRELSVEDAEAIYRSVL
jgi:alcohol dehydrogenase